MQTAARTMAITFPVADAGFLKKLSSNMGWQMVSIPTCRKRATTIPKIKMTEEEFRAKLAESSAQGAAGRYIEMQSDETANQFLNRIVCTPSV